MLETLMLKSLMAYFAFQALGPLYGDRSEIFPIHFLQALLFFPKIYASLFFWFSNKASQNFPDIAKSYLVQNYIVLNEHNSICQDLQIFPNANSMLSFAEQKNFSVLTSLKYQ